MLVLASAAAALTLFADWSVAAQQWPLAAPPTTLADTIVSALSASTEHTIFLRLLQRSKSIPLLAHIGNATVYAPTDDAWKSWFERHTPSEGESPYLGWLGPSGYDFWSAGDDGDLNAHQDGVSGEEAFDNQNWALRQHLLYHILNYTLPRSALAVESDDVSIETTLLFPLASPPSLPPTPPPGPPWLPRGGEGLLGGHGQRLRFARPKSKYGGKRGRVGMDHTGSGGAQLWLGDGWAHGNASRSDDLKSAKWVRNGVVIGIEDVLDPPPSIDVVLQTLPDLTYLAKILSLASPLPSPLPNSLATSPHLTVFAPSNKAFGIFDEVERRYLEGDYGTEGVVRIFGGSVVLGVDGEHVGWSDQLGMGSRSIEAASGLTLDVETSSEQVMVNSTRATAVDVFASNGVVHILPSLLLPESFELLNSAEKMLLSINATRFVSLLRSANLSSTYIGGRGDDGGTEQAWTILAPTDEALDTMDRWAGHPAALTPHDGAAPFEDVSPIAALLQYHILPGRLLPDQIRDGMLVDTELRTSALAGGRQKLRIAVSDSLDRQDWENASEGEIRFGGVSTLGKPVKIGRSVIYLISSLLAPPDDVLQTAVSDLQLSTFVAAVYAADLDRAVKKTPAVTYFMPRNRAFASLGLGMKYLLLPEGKDELRKLIRYHIIDQVVYADDVEEGKTTYKTLEGGKIVLARNESLVVSSPTKWEGHDSGAHFPANGELRPAAVNRYDALASTGVIHTIDSVVMPADVTLTIGKLVRGAKHSTMSDLLIRAGLGWILEGRAPSSEEVSAAALDGVVTVVDGDNEATSLAMPSYTLMVPTDQAFSRLNVSRYLNDRDALLDLLKLHIIPTQPSTPRSGSSKEPAEPPRDGQPLSMADDLVYTTLLSSKSKFGDVAFRATGDNSYIVGIRGSRNNAGVDFARVGQSGRASVRWRNGLRSLSDVNYDLWNGGMALGGGVLVIDSVLIPYEPRWFSRWGWLVITLVGVGIVLLIAGGSIGWWWITKGKNEHYAPLEGEEED